MVEAETVRQMRDLAARGWRAKRIARELGVARNALRRYLRGWPGAEVQERARRCVCGAARADRHPAAGAKKPHGTAAIQPWLAAVQSRFRFPGPNAEAVRATDQT
jgi:hypothetical protein